MSQSRMQVSTQSSIPGLVNRAAPGFLEAPCCTDREIVASSDRAHKLSVADLTNSEKRQCEYSKLSNSILTRIRRPVVCPTLGSLPNESLEHEKPGVPPRSARQLLSLFSDCYESLIVVDDLPSGLQATSPGPTTHRHEQGISRGPIVRGLGTTDFARLPQ